VGEERVEGGIDRRSSAADIRDALMRLGADLDTSSRGNQWRAQIRDGASTGHGATEAEAAYDVWQQYLELQGGIGTS
jgi:hypothetical protein